MNIVIVDDHLLFTQLLQNNLSRSFKDSTVRSFSDPGLFLNSNFDEWLPDLLICDLVMPGIDGMDVVEKTRKLLGDRCKIIIMSGVTDIATVKSAIKRGVNGYVAKNADLLELVAAIKVVTSGSQYISKALNEDLLNHIFSDDPVILHLSPKEKEVLQKFCEGMVPKEIAIAMNLSIHTVNQYNKSIMKKIGVNRTTDMVLFAIQKGLFGSSCDRSFN